VAVSTSKATFRSAILHTLSRRSNRSMYRPDALSCTVSSSDTNTYQTPSPCLGRLQSLLAKIITFYQRCAIAHQFHGYVRDEVNRLLDVGVSLYEILDEVIDIALKLSMVISRIIVVCRLHRYPVLAVNSPSVANEHLFYSRRAAAYCIRARLFTTGPPALKE